MQWSVYELMKQVTTGSPLEGGEGDGAPNELLVSRPASARQDADASDSASAAQKAVLPPIASSHGRPPSEARGRPDFSRPLGARAAEASASGPSPPAERGAGRPSSTPSSTGGGLMSSSAMSSSTMGSSTLGRGRFKLKPGAPVEGLGLASRDIDRVNIPAAPVHSGVKSVVSDVSRLANRPLLPPAASGKGVLAGRRKAA